MMARVFSSDKMVDSPLLNAAGVQVFRAVVARGIYLARSASVSRTLVPVMDQLHRDGVAVVPDFMPPRTFAAIRAECEGLAAEGAYFDRYEHGTTRVSIMAMSRAPMNRLPAIRAFYQDSRLLEVFSAAERRPLPSLLEYGKHESISFDEESRQSDDPQTTLHSDIFFNTHKAWLYLGDVTVDDGPLVYVKGSHRLALGRLGFIYRDSSRWNKTISPSRRISLEEQRDLDVVETVVTCPANTLVIANTCGYRRRLAIRAVRRRESLHVSVRSHPFAVDAMRASLARIPGARTLARAVRGSAEGS